MNAVFVSILGNPHRTIVVTLTDVYQKLGDLLDAAAPEISFVDGAISVPGQLAPVGVLVSTPTGGKNVDLGFGAVAPGGVAHELAAAYSFSGGGAQMVNKMWLRNQTAGQNASVAVTLFF